MTKGLRELQASELAAELEKAILPMSSLSWVTRETGTACASPISTRT